MTSPSAGMISPAATITISPTSQIKRRDVLEARSSRLGHQQALGPVSVRVRRKASACALPRPSATASAKLANSTVNHSHSGDLPGKPGGAIAEEVAQPEYRHQCRHHLGHKHDRVLRHLARIELSESIAAARDRIALSKRCGATAFLVDMDWLRQKVLPASIRKCSTIGPSAKAGKYCSPPRIRITPMSRATNKCHASGMCRPKAPAWSWRQAIRQSP